MPRNSSGTYSQTSGNPVVAGTTITASRENDTNSDLGNEITNSLDRNGRGAMLAPLKAYAGTVSAPGVVTSADTNTGLYWDGADDVRMAVGGADFQQWTAGSGTAIPVAVETTAGITASHDTSGSLAIDATGNEAAAIKGTGGADSAGIWGVGGASNGNGGLFTGDGTGKGVDATGGDNSGAGVKGTGGATNGIGVNGIGTGSGAGGNFTGGATGNGVTASAGVTGGHGVAGTGVGATGAGGYFTGPSAINGAVAAVASGNGIGIVALGAGTGAGGTFQSAGTGYGIVVTGNATRAPISIGVLSGDPSSATEGDLYYNSTTHKLMVHTGGGFVAVH